MKGVVRSRYEEDVYPSNHTSVWGSYWETGEWGYKCCRSLVQNSYCTGKSGIALSKNISELKEVTPSIDNDISEGRNTLKNTTDQVETMITRNLSSSSSLSESESEQKLKEKKRKKKMKKKKKSKKEEIKDSLKKALEKEDERLKEVDRVMNMDERKRPYNSMYDVAKPTDEEIEAYHMKKRRNDDPMANFVN